MLRERFIRKTFMPLGFTTVDFTDVDVGNILLASKGQGKLKKRVVKIPDNGTQGVNTQRFRVWRNFFDKSSDRVPSTTIRNDRNEFLRRLGEGESVILPEFGGATVVYHGPGNSIKYKTR